MKFSGNLYIIVCLLCVLLCSCRHRGLNSSMGASDSIDVEIPTELNEEQETLEVFKHDSLASTNCVLFEFNEIGAIFDETRGELYISGFATDGWDNHYFAAGSPIMITAYHNTEELWKKMISNKKSTLGLFKFVKDSLYLFEESPAQIIRMAASGEGQADTLKLPLKRIIEGRCMDNQYFLIDSIEYQQQYLFCSTFKYPNVLIEEKRQTFLSHYSLRTNEEIEVNMNLPEGLSQCSYKGTIAGCHIYTSRSYGDCTMIIRDEEKKIHLFPIRGMPDLNVAVSPTESLPVTNESYDILINGKLYLLGYNRDQANIIMHAIDIRSLIGEIHNHGTR